MNGNQNISIRKAVIDNLSSSNNNSNKEIIDDATSSNTETILPGLGVMFEVLWKNSQTNEKNDIVNRISENIR